MMLRLLKIAFLSKQYMIIKFAFFLFLITPIVQAQEREFEEGNLSNFLISFEVENNESGKLTCDEGCAWKELGFQHSKGASQNINFYGMTNSSKDKSDSSDNMFFINIHRDEDQIVLSCDLGCAWRSLTFRVPSKGQKISLDAFGLKIS